LPPARTRCRTGARTRCGTGARTHHGTGAGPVTVA